jgi:hypothetical protein
VTPDTPVQDMTAVFVELLRDTVDAQARTFDPDTPSDRRTYVRSLFALMEGLNYCQRRLALEHPGFSASARARASAAAKRGAAEAKKMHLGRAAAATRVSFATFAAAHGVSNPLVCSDPGWQDYLAAITVRNRITHPRSGPDCVISDEDLALVRRVHRWYQSMSERLLELPRNPAAAPAGHIPTR